MPDDAPAGAVAAVAWASAIGAMNDVVNTSAAALISFRCMVSLFVCL
jgi:hypothetical protein